MGTKFIHRSLIIYIVTIIFIFLYGYCIPCLSNTVEFNGKISYDNKQYGIITYWHCSDAPMARKILTRYDFYPYITGYKCVIIKYFDHITFSEFYLLDENQKNQIFNLLDDYSAQYLSSNNIYEICEDAPYQLQLMQRINAILNEGTTFRHIKSQCYNLSDGYNKTQKIDSDIELEEFKMPIFKAQEVEFINIMKYLARSAVPVGDNVYFNVKENESAVLYEIGLSNKINYIAKPHHTGIKISLECTNISVRAAAQLVANHCGMKYNCTNSIIQLQLDKIPIATDDNVDAKSSNRN